MAAQLPRFVSFDVSRYSISTYEGDFRETLSRSVSWSPISRVIADPMDVVLNGILGLVFRRVILDQHSRAPLNEQIGERVPALHGCSPKLMAAR